MSIVWFHLIVWFSFNCSVIVKTNLQFPGVWQWVVSRNGLWRVKERHLWCDENVLHLGEDNSYMGVYIWTNSSILKSVHFIDINYTLRKIYNEKIHTIILLFDLISPYTPTPYFFTLDEYLSIKLNFIYLQSLWPSLFNHKYAFSTHARHCYVSWKYSNDFFPGISLESSSKKPIWQGL